MTGGTPYYLTTPIFYVNDVPHIGHAYVMVACDALARFMRLDGRNVHFLTGTDEHGQKVEKSAQAAGEAPIAFCDRVSQNFRDCARLMNVSNDDFIRTTEPRHIRACQALWREIAVRKSPKGRDNIYLGTYAGWYAVRDEAFYAEKELTTGPDGKKRAPSGAEVEWVEEPSYFFRLSDWQDWLLDYYRTHDLIAPPERRNEVVTFVEGGLHDLSVSRTSFTWGVPVPDDPSREGLKIMTERAKAALDSGVSLIGFAEGSRTRDGHVQPFKKGIFRIAQKFGAPIVPMSIVGSYDFFQTGSWMLHPGKIIVYLHDTIDSEQVTKDDPDQLRLRVQEIVSRPVDEFIASKNPDQG